ncbi:MAG: 50S ribosomal protein L23 [Parcubacteria group bacterium]|nr:50S ribosomal protein L23 [Parcubacteria group bacterium]
MFNFLKNPFSQKEAPAPRKSAQKEREAQKQFHAPAEKKSGGQDVPADSPVAKKPSAKTDLGAGYGIIMRPHVSEKTARTGTYDTYAFVVSRHANKIEIKKAFWKMYGVHPLSIQVANVATRSTYFRRIPGFKSAWKKAYIRVPKGSNVAVYEGV